MRIDEFQQRLRESVLIADGAMGSLLYENLGPQRCVDELNATRAEEVFRIHMAYLEAGAHIIETNTFGANRNKLSAFGLEERVTEFNHRGVKIAREAREAARHEVLIAGSIGPLGGFRDPREATPEHFREIFREQAEALEERGVDFFVLETFGNPVELLAAIEAIRSFSQLPIVAEMTYSEEGSTFSGFRPKDAWALLHERGVQVIGAQLLRGAAGPFANSAGTCRGGGLVSDERDAQRGISAARRRSRHLSEILAGIFRSLRSRSRGAGRANSRRVLRNHAGTYSRDGARGGRHAPGLAGAAR